jgi:hypothetical protein
MEHDPSRRRDRDTTDVGEVDQSVLPSPSSKRPRVAARCPENDSAMTDIDPVSALMVHSQALSLLDLPMDCLKRVLAHVTSPLRSSSVSSSALAAALPLRLVCKHMRTAFDAHVVHFDFSGLSSYNSVSLVILRALPRFFCLCKLTLNEYASDRAFAHHWAVLFSRDPRHIRSICFHGAAPLSTVPGIISVGCGVAVEDLSVVTSTPTTSTAILSWFAQNCPFVRTVDARLDDVDSRVLAGFSSLRSINILFRTDGVSLRDIQMLIWALTQCASTLESVDLRVHDHEVAQKQDISAEHEQDPLCLLSHLPRLRRLSLFSMRGWPAAFPGWLSAASFLSELCLEWCDDMRDADFEEVTRLLGPRLHRVRVWNCNALTDDALRSLAQNTDPAAALDLSFRSGQFSPSVLYALGDRAIWESWGGPATSTDTDFQFPPQN